MALCNKCGTNVEEGVKFCTKCGADMTAPVVEQATPVQEIPAVEQAAHEQNAEQKNDFSEKVAALNDTADTTAEFDAADIEKNKIMAVLAYILFFIPLLAAKDSKFARFHTNQGLVLFISAIIASVVAIIPVIGWIVAPILGVAVTILSIIGIINALNGRAKELPVIGKFKVLK